MKSEKTKIAHYYVYKLLMQKCDYIEPVPVF